MGRQFRAVNTFSANDSNTICDLTGFKVKMSEVRRRWEGFYVLASTWHPRQPQDFPVIPQPQHVHKNVRIEQVEAEGAVSSFDIV